MDPSAHLVASTVAESIARTEGLIERQRTLVAQAHPSKRACETKALDHLLKTSRISGATISHWFPKPKPARSPLQILGRAYHCAMDRYSKDTEWL